MRLLFSISCYKVPLSLLFSLPSSTISNPKLYLPRPVLKMRFSTFASVALLIAPIFALPALNSEERKLFGRDSGSYTVSGLGARKKAVIAAGGNVFDIAIAMLETETMTTDYTYGDGKTCKFFFLAFSFEFNGESCNSLAPREYCKDAVNSQHPSETY